MRYLYADSEPFPLEYDLLATLRSFLHAAAQVYGHLARIEDLEADIAKRAQETQAVLGSIAEFTEAMEAARSAASGHFAAVAEVLALSSDIEAYLQGAGAGARTRCARSNEDKSQAALAEIETLRKSSRAVVEDFVLNAQLGMEVAHAHFALKDERYDLRVGGWTHGAVEVDYGVTTDRLPEWKEPRRVSALTGDLVLQVGMKKKFLSKSMTRELIDVSDYALGDVRTNPHGIEAQLRRKAASAKECVVVSLSQTEAGLTGTIARPEHEGGAPFPMATEDVPKIEKLRQKIDEVARAALPKRSAVHTVRLDGQDVFVQGLFARLCDRFVERFAPLVHEIARRSPSPLELSLKLERDDGRREELYLRKSDLQEELTALPPRMRERFSPLGFR
ncbi:MAG: hypothetical protein IT378_10940 [Sandaracinaceae bacterium]|nr:hypothetical protein [Sandaracinaceae bacterium]